MIASTVFVCNVCRGGGAADYFTLHKDSKFQMRRGGRGYHRTYKKEEATADE